MSLFELLNTFPTSCIYAFVDESNKSMYVHFSETAAIMQLSRALLDLKRNEHDNRLLQDSYNRGSLTIRVLKDYMDNAPLEAIIRLECIDIVKDLGYTDMRNPSRPVYRIVTRVMVDYRDKRSEVPLVYVLSKSTTPEYLVLSIHDHIMEAEEWIKSTYPGYDPSVGIVPSFALNERTREYHELHGYKLLT